MKELEKGEYLAPEAEVVAMTICGNVLLNGSITDSSENSEIGW